MYQNTPLPEGSTDPRDQLEAELKALIVTTLNLEGVDPAGIDAEAPLFGEGLGLDSIDALELGVALKRRYGVTFDAQSPETAEAFRSVRSLAVLVGCRTESPS
jgi:acyl carrier protein